MKKVKEKPAAKVWECLKENENLTDQQVDQFKIYANLLIEWNKKFNLTGIKDLSGIARQHFQDSIVLRKFLDLNKINTLVDIGTGAGFPAIPLKILFPHLKMFLIEVNKKKIEFLNFLISGLYLKDVEVVDLDWRTFLRKMDADVDVFLTRAAMNDLELSRMFKPACPYKNTTLVYWASIDWQPHQKVKHLVKEIKEYKLGKKERKLVFMKNEG